MSRIYARGNPVTTHSEFPTASCRAPCTSKSPVLRLSGYYNTRTRIVAIGYGVHVSAAAHRSLDVKRSLINNYPRYLGVAGIRRAIPTVKDRPASDTPQNRGYLSRDPERIASGPNRLPFAIAISNLFCSGSETKRAKPEHERIALNLPKARSSQTF